MKQKSEYHRQYSGLKSTTPKSISCYTGLIFVITVFCLQLAAYADENPLDRMRDEALSYFKPVTGKILTVENKNVTVNSGTGNSVRKGMRFTILREEAPFIHPVTKEPLGKLEAYIGRIEIKDAGKESSSGVIIEGTPRDGDKVRISEIKVNILFCQSKNTDWQLSDAYYRKLKETERFNIIDTSIDTDDPAKVIEEAKRLRADVALLVTSRTDASGTLLKQRLFWVADSVQFSEMETEISAAVKKELKFGEEFFKSIKTDATVRLDVPFEAQRIIMADVNGDGKQELVIATEREILFYTLGVDLQPAFGGTKIRGSGLDTFLWIDAVDLNKNGRDEIIVTSMKDSNVVSYIYEMQGTEFVLLHKDNLFMRKMGDGLIAQEYFHTEGFEGPVFSIYWDKTYQKGSALKLPTGINIYDFIYLDTPGMGRLTVAYDSSGYLNVFDSKQTRVWRSKTSAGGFLTTFKKSVPTEMHDKGEWAIKDRLLFRDNEILSVKRIPFIEMAKGVGYKGSLIRKMWWNGLSMEEGILIDDIDGTVHDYAIAGDKVIVLASPMFGVKAGNILKGENPLKTELYIYSVKRM